MNHNHEWNERTENDELKDTKMARRADWSGDKFYVGLANYTSDLFQCSFSISRFKLAWCYTESSVAVPADCR